MADQRNRNSNDIGDVGRDALVDDLLGRDQWRRSKLGYLTGAGSLRQSMSTLGRAGASIGGTFRTFGRAAFGRNESTVRAVDAIDPAERFQTSMFVHGRTESDIVALQRRSHNAFYLYAVLAFAAILLGALTFRFVSPSIQIPAWLNILFRFAAVPMMLGFAFRWGYTNYIVRNRSYLSAGDYLRSGDWFPQLPAKPARGRGSRALQRLSMIAIGALVASSVVPFDALAQTATPAANTGSGGLQQAFDVFKTPGQNDLFMNLLSLILPNVGPVPGLTGQAAAGSPAHNALSQGLMIFSGILLLVACTMVAWHTITGTVMSAQTGKVLGEQWSQVWSPARVVVGLGFLIPISGGFCAAQILVLYLVAWGGSAANMIWTPYVQSIVNGSATTAEATAIADKAKFISNLPGSYDAVRQIAEKEICYETLKTVYNRGGTTNFFNGIPDSLQWDTSNLGDRIAITGDLVMSTLNPNYWGLIDNTYARYVTQKTKTMNYGAVCGKIVINSINDELSAATVNNSDNAGLEAAVAAEYDKGRFAAVTAAQNAMRSTIQQAVKSYFPTTNGGGGGGQQGAFYFREGSGIQNVATQFKTAVQVYNEAMLAAAQNALQKGAPSSGGSSGNSNVATLTKDLGWASAGMFYATLARVQGVVYSRASYPPTFSPAILSADEMTADDQWASKALYSTSDTQPGTLSDFRGFWIRNNRSFLMDQDRAANAAMAGTSTLKTSLFGELSDGVSWWVIDQFLDALKINPFNAMLSLVELGQSILSWITALGATIGVLSMLSIKPAAMLGSAVMDGSGKGGVIGSFFLTVGVLILSSLFGAGITLAYILPMIPYLIVTFFVMSMLILVAEAMVAAPLWAFFHVRMEGQQFVESVQRPGYMISFNLLLRPSLMILGLIMSYLIHGAMAWFVWQTFKIAAKSATAGFSVGPVGAVVFLTMYAYINYMIALRCFNLAVQVPDRVARWFGGQGEHTDEERMTQQASGAISGSVSRQASQLIDGGTIGAALGVGRGGGGGGNRSLPGGGGRNSLPHLKNATSGAAGGGESEATEAGGSQGGGQGGGGGGDAGQRHGSGRDYSSSGRANAEAPQSAGRGGSMAGRGGSMAGYTGNEGSRQGTYSTGGGGGGGRSDGSGDKRGGGRRSDEGNRRAPTPPSKPNSNGFQRSEEIGESDRRDDDR